MDPLREDSAPKGMTADSYDSVIGSAVRDIKRLRDITKLIVSHGFGEWMARSPIGRRLMRKAHATGGPVVEGTSAQRFGKLLESLGPTYIKFGQILSMRPDLLPAEFISALGKLQDHVEPVPFEDIRQVIESGLGHSLEDLFAQFEEKPLATASIGQTHLATLRSGERVVVKVQRPGIEAVIRSDLDILFFFAKVFEAAIEEARFLEPSGTVREFERALTKELDFRQELSNLITAQSFLDPERPVQVPIPYPEYSCKTVLTMEFFRGIPIRKLEPKTPRAKYIVEEIVHASAKQVLIDGFFHGDPHMGNILINDDDDICMIDLGMVGKLTESQRGDFIAIIIALMSKNPGGVARVLMRMGTPTRRINLTELRAYVGNMMETYLNFQRIEDFDMVPFLDDFIGGATKFGIKLAPEYLVLIKAAATIDGIIRNLSPEVDIVTIGKPYAQQIISKRFSVGSVLSETIGGVTGIGTILRQMPVQVEQILHDAETGNTQVHVVNSHIEQIAPMIHQLGSRLATTAFAGVLTLVGGLSVIFKGPPLFAVANFALAFFAWTALGVWHIFGRGRPLRVRSITQFFRRT